MRQTLVFTVLLALGCEPKNTLDTDDAGRRCCTARLGAEYARQPYFLRFGSPATPACRGRSSC